MNKIIFKNERAEIFRLFLENSKLKFSEIEKALNIRSNNVSYHLEKMKNSGLIEKRNEFYYLTKDAEKYLPIFSNIVGKELSPTPIVLVAITNKDKILLMKRTKRPYKDYWGVIGGKMLLDETFEQASIRLVEEKASIEGKFISLNSIFHERVKEEGVIKHSFILFFTKIKATTLDFKETNYGKLRWFGIEELRKHKIIPSDLWLIKNKLKSKTNINKAIICENKDNLLRLKLEAN